MEVVQDCINLREGMLVLLYHLAVGMGGWVILLSWKHIAFTLKVIL